MVARKPISEGIGFVSRNMIQNFIAERGGKWIVDAGIVQTPVVYADTYLRFVLLVLDDNGTHPLCFFYWKDETCSHHLVNLNLDLFFDTWVQPVGSVLDRPGIRLQHNAHFSKVLLIPFRFATEDGNKSSYSQRRLKISFVISSSQ